MADTKTETSIVILLNGKASQLPDGVTVSTFLDRRGLQDRLVVVELNGVILDRSAFPTTLFREGDRVEVVHFVGGG